MTTLLDFIDLRDRSIQERFEEFHRLHPEVMDKLVDLAREVKRGGLKRCGISLLWERARWYWTFERPEVGFKLDNFFRSRYVRLIMATYPEEFGEFFETRELKAE